MTSACGISIQLKNKTQKMNGKAEWKKTRSIADVFNCGTKCSFSGCESYKLFDLCHLIHRLLSIHKIFRIFIGVPIFPCLHHPLKNINFTRKFPLITFHVAFFTKQVLCLTDFFCIDHKMWSNLSGKSIWNYITTCIESTTTKIKI